MLRVPFTVPFSPTRPRTSPPPFFGAQIGGFASMLCSLVLPCALYAKLCKKYISGATFWFNIFLAILGVVLAMGITYLNIAALIAEIASGGAGADSASSAGG